MEQSGALPCHVKQAVFQATPKFQVPKRSKFLIIKFQLHFFLFRPNWPKGKNILEGLSAQINREVRNLKCREPSREQQAPPSCSPTRKSIAQTQDSARSLKTTSQTKLIQSSQDLWMRARSNHTFQEKERSLGKPSQVQNAQESLRTWITKSQGPTQGAERLTRKPSKKPTPRGKVSQMETSQGAEMLEISMQNNGNIIEAQQGTAEGTLIQTNQRTKSNLDST
jgi:hypothetical protein